MVAPSIDPIESPITVVDDGSVPSRDTAAGAGAGVQLQSAKSAKVSHAKLKEDEKKREMSKFLKQVFPQEVVKEENQVAAEKRTKILDLLGLKENKKSAASKEKK